MDRFIVYPAIDLRHGNAVRLQQGKIEGQTLYNRDPARVADTWIQQGAQWLHVVNLDGAFVEGTQQNGRAVQQIISVSKGRLKIQLGGGIRTQAQIADVLGLGVTRVILGTSVIQNPEFGKEALKSFTPEKLGFAFDALEGQLKTHGWRSNSKISIDFLAGQLANAGARTIIFTNIAKDGMQSGVDWENAKRIADDYGLEVIASGGVASLGDIAAVRSAGLAGVIVGRALYSLC